MIIIEKIIKSLITIGKPFFRIFKIGLNLFRKFWKKITLFLVIIIFLIFFLNIYNFLNKELPDVNLIYNPPKLSSKIFDRNGILLYKFYEEENRTWVSLDKIPKKFIEATLAIEDKDFYKHNGLSLKGIIKATIYNFRKSNGDKLRGGSTISQQLIKNVFLTNEKSFIRKIKEAILTIKIENKLTKNEILERYFNQVSYGGEAYGAQEAAWKYFGKDIWSLNEGEMTYLAGLPAAPSSYSYFGNNPELGISRQRRVIEEMVSANYIDKEKGEEILKQKLVFRIKKQNIEAPHFVFYIKSLLENKYGFVNFERQGLDIYTSLDLNIQKETEKNVSEEIEKVKKLKISNGAALVIEVKNGDILAMVGSKNYEATDIDGNVNVTTALRQPGSSIKPINYLLAFEKGKNMDSYVEDSPVSYYVPGQKVYSPQNYNGKYMGRVTLKTALASSLNVPSVKLLKENGVNNMIDLAESMGINTWKERNRYGLSLALGSGEVKMTELAQAYSVFANLGEKVEINPIYKIDNYLGENIYKKEKESNQIVSSDLALMINNILSDNQARSPIFGLNSKLKIEGKTVAVKTGTTNNLKDNWCIGWTPSYLVATWVGNNDGSPMSWIASGVSGATPIWNKTMTKILSNKIDEQWTESISMPDDKIIFEENTNTTDQQRLESIF
ncbi:MAG: PBP1A family penicillin-binding protein [Candidatus Shapirobacteria bacterium]|nr:PBP1A family penicillin-binding protein [Candidatus Shapirobacteria bacterium]